MDTKVKPAPGGNREAGLNDALDSRNHSPIHARLKALLIGLAAYDAALLALIFLIAWRVLK
jgi:hypothetical protein